MVKSVEKTTSWYSGFGFHPAQHTELSKITDRETQKVMNGLNARYYIPFYGSVLAARTLYKTSGDKAYGMDAKLKKSIRAQAGLALVPIVSSVLLLPVMDVSVTTYRAVHFR